ncbi:cytidylate kinase [Plesiocystis pacifica SIR-1]|uniref:Cytidylate kinase n=1 Tax=Plesiocystis pacifica SIR-1 TaxID=391625 RepID=A6G716_9BACT|nr:(d)CMP kinase [Plesiocystis pacifica]EDM78292.1 cytidylate kinase [Plesiocystis pacifica SIR-1]
MAGPLIAIDGPAGAGKTTVARAVARELGAALLDTGAIYRSLAWLARERGVDWGDEPALATLAESLRIEFVPAPASEPDSPQRVLVRAPESADVTAVIRTPEVSEGASRVSSLPAVRGALLGIQRAIAAKAVEAGGCVAEGRDMGTVVFPNTPHKFFLTASSGARADRRYRELVAKGVAETSVGEVEAQMRVRDQRDSSRDSAPLRQADDATLVDSSEMGVEQVVTHILAAVRASPV